MRAFLAGLAVWIVCYPLARLAPVDWWIPLGALIGVSIVLIEDWIEGRQ